MKTLKNVDLQFVAGGSAFEVISSCVLLGGLSGSVTGFVLDIAADTPILCTSAFAKFGMLVGAKVGMNLVLATETFTANESFEDDILLGIL